MRHKINRQAAFDSSPSNLKLTRAYYKRYEAVSKVLDENPRILNLLHADLKDALTDATMTCSDCSNYKYTSDTVLRMLVCHVIEGGSLRSIIIRIDDSPSLRRFVHIYDGPMMDFTTFCKLKNCIDSKTWEKVNKVLAQYAVNEEMMDGDQLRLDTTAVETNIHWPSDSSLLGSRTPGWGDAHRVLARLIKQARNIDYELVGHRRLLTRKTRRLSVRISRQSTGKQTTSKTLKPLYEKLIPLVESICVWSAPVQKALEERARQPCLSEAHRDHAASLAQEMAHYHHLALRVIYQATRRVLCDETVPNNEKVFSVFEPHTELLKRGHEPPVGGRRGRPLSLAT